LKKLVAGLKSFARRALPRRLQEYLRSHYLTRKVLAGKYVEPEMAILNSLVRAGQVVVDIGANVGYYTIRLSELVGSSGRVYSFEPITENFRILERAVKGKQLENVTTILAAVESKPGEGDMVIPIKDDFTGFYQARLGAESAAGTKQHVKVVSLDQLWSDGTLPTVDFIKCDAEGSELRILQGAIRLLRTKHPSLLLEVQSQTGMEVFELLHGLGYKSFILNDELEEIAQFDPKFWNYFFLEQNEAIRILNYAESAGPKKRL
jgi:FkbM family methyltransferase